MDSNTTALTFEEIATARAAIRVLRAFGLVTLSALVPAAVVLATPLLGYALLTALVGSPLLFVGAFVAAARQDERERRAS